MKTNISHLKQHLSENLQEVKKGKTITILDRKTPIALLVPYDKKHQPVLSIRPPIAKFIDFGISVDVGFDPLAYLDKEDKWLSI